MPGISDRTGSGTGPTAPDTSGTLASGTLDKALERIRFFGPERHSRPDRYRAKLEEMPDRVAAATPANWREVLAEWWTRLPPGIAAGATHPVIRVGHATHPVIRVGHSVRTLLDGERTHPAPRTTEPAHGLGYWASRHQPLSALAPAPSAAAALDAVAPAPDRSGGIRDRLSLGGPGSR